MGGGWAQAIESFFGPVKWHRADRRVPFGAQKSSVADTDPGSGIGCLFDPWIRDPGWEKVSIRIRDEQLGSYFLELRNHFFGVEILKLFDEDPGWRQFGSGIQDGKKSDPG